jgi:hypothetical protein
MKSISCVFSIPLDIPTPPASTKPISKRFSFANQWPRSADSIAEPRRGKSFRFCRFFSPILRWCVRFEGMNETTRDLGYFIDSSLERGLVCLRRFVKAADFSHELERSILNLFGGYGRIKIEKRLDIPAHSHDLSETPLNACTVLLTAQTKCPCRSFARVRYYIPRAALVLCEEARRGGITAYQQPVKSASFWQQPEDHPHKGQERKLTAPIILVVRDFLRPRKCRSHRPRGN